MLVKNGEFSPHMVKRGMNKDSMICRTTVSWSSAYTARLWSEKGGDSRTCYYGLVKDRNMHNCQVNLGSVIIDNRTRTWRHAQKDMVRSILLIQVITKLLLKVIKWKPSCSYCSNGIRNASLSARECGNHRWQERTASPNTVDGNGPGM